MADRDVGGAPNSPWQQGLLGSGGASGAVVVWLVRPYCFHKLPQAALSFTGITHASAQEVPLVTGRAQHRHHWSPAQVDQACRQGRACCCLLQPCLELLVLLFLLRERFLACPSNQSFHKRGMTMCLCIGPTQQQTVFLEVVVVGACCFNSQQSLYMSHILTSLSSLPVCDTPGGCSLTGSPASSATWQQVCIQ